MAGPLIGEVLFDRFPDGTQVLGGAPFNVAWHLQGFGLKPRFVSRVGHDAAGDRVRESMDAWGMDQTGLRIDPDHATGAVDINLREPWWRAENLPWLLRRARWVKINDEELEIIVKTLELAGGDLDAKARRIQESFAVELLILTLGSKGARALRPATAPVEVLPEPAKKVVDTVGAGDAFASVSILGLLKGWSAATILERAQQIAGVIVQQRGATSRDPELYARLLSEWGI